MSFVLHAIFFFQQALAGNFFSRSPTPSPKELNGRPLTSHFISSVKGERKARNRILYGSFRGDVLIAAFAKEKAASLNTFTVRDVGIKRSDVKRDKYGIVGKCVDCVQVGKFVKD